MKMRLKRCIKKNINENYIYKIVNKTNGKFKECGSSIDCNSHGKTWYKYADVKRAYNLIPEANKSEFSIVCIRVKVKEILEEK